MIFLDGCEAAIIGHVDTGQGAEAVYEYNALVQVFVDQGMAWSVAQEWVDFNIVGTTPPFILYTGDSDEVFCVAENE